MISKKLFTYTAMAAIALSVTVAACNKDNDDDAAPVTEEDITYASDDAKLDQIFGEVEDFANEVELLGSANLKGGSPLGSGCANVNRDTATNMITIDFGSQNCLCKDGRYRRGKILVSYTDTLAYKAKGYTHIISFSDYYVNDEKVSGMDTVLTRGYGDHGYMYYKVDFDGQVTSTKGGTVRKKANYVRAWSAGESTPQIADDVFNITGASTLTIANGDSYDVRITQALIMPVSCSWTSAGVSQIAPWGSFERILRYGTGACDDQATLSINTTTRNMTLK